MSAAAVWWCEAAEYTFDEEYWSLVSEEAKDLIRKLLVVDPDKRLTADQVTVRQHLCGAAPHLASSRRDGGGSQWSAARSTKRNRGAVAVVPWRPAGGAQRASSGQRERSLPLQLPIWRPISRRRTPAMHVTRLTHDAPRARPPHSASPRRTRSPRQRRAGTMELRGFEMLVSREAIRHPWFMKGDHELIERSLETTLKTMKTFNAKRKLKGTVKTVMMANRLGKGTL